MPFNNGPKYDEVRHSIFESCPSCTLQGPKRVEGNEMVHLFPKDDDSS